MCRTSTFVCLFVFFKYKSVHEFEKNCFGGRIQRGELLLSALKLGTNAGKYI